MSYPVSDVFWSDIGVFGLYGGEIVFMQNNLLVGFNEVIKTLTVKLNRIAFEPLTGQIVFAYEVCEITLEITKGGGGGGTASQP